MKAIVISEDGLSVKEIDKPLVGESSLLIKVMAAGICGTDLAIVSGSLKTPMPLILGHEFSGEVAERGRSIGDIAVGTRVTGEINLTCGRCHFCEAGFPTHCLNRKAIGIDVNGAFADYIAVPAKNIHFLVAPLGAPHSSPYPLGYIAFSMASSPPSLAQAGSLEQSLFEPAVYK